MMPRSPTPSLCGVLLATDDASKAMTPQKPCLSAATKARRGPSKQATSSNSNSPIPDTPTAGPCPAARRSVRRGVKVSEREGFEADDGIRPVVFVHSTTASPPKPFRAAMPGRAYDSGQVPRVLQALIKDEVSYSIQLNPIQSTDPINQTQNPPAVTTHTAAPPGLRGAGRARLALCLRFGRTPRRVSVAGPGLSGALPPLLRR